MSEGRPGGQVTLLDGSGLIPLGGDLIKGFFPWPKYPPRDGGGGRGTGHRPSRSPACHILHQTAHALWSALGPNSATA